MNLADLKELPSNILAERALIASIVDNNDILFDLSVNSSMFYGSEEKQIMKVIETISKETKSIDTTIVYWKLKEWLKDYFFSDVMLCSYSYTKYKQYEMEIEEKYKQRNLIKLGNDIATLATDYSNIDQIKTLTSKVLLDWIKDNTKSFMEAFADTLDNLGKRWDIICPFWYWKLNNLKGYVEWNLVVIGARPKVGKSTFIINLMKSIATQWIKSVLFSLEMNRTEISERFISMLTATSSYKLDHLNEEEKSKIIYNANKHLETISMMEVVDTISSAEKIYMGIRKFAYEWYKIVFIDYLQLMSGEWTNANDRIGKITTNLKRLASELWICIVILSQLNRDAAKWTPELHNLRDSWSIEQDANMVMFLNYSEDTPKVLEVNVAANRSWPTFNTELTYIREFYFITD